MVSCCKFWTYWMGVNTKFTQHDDLKISYLHPPCIFKIYNMTMGSVGAQHTKYWSLRLYKLYLSCINTSVVHRIHVDTGWDKADWNCHPKSRSSLSLIQSGGRFVITDHSSHLVASPGTTPRGHNNGGKWPRTSHKESPAFFVSLTLILPFADKMMRPLSKCTIADP